MTPEEQKQLLELALIGWCIKNRKEVVPWTDVRWITSRLGISPAIADSYLRLLKCVSSGGANMAEALATAKTEQAAMPILQLIRLFIKEWKSAKFPNPPVVGSILPAMRLLCKQAGPKVVQDSIAPFFQHKAGEPTRSFEQFTHFVRRQCKHVNK